MASLDELKARITERSRDSPERFFAVDAIRRHGFVRDECRECGTMFWSQDGSREVCGEPDCAGGYTFIDDSPASETFSIVEAWDAFSDFMDDRGYTPIQRYPIAARWRDDTDVVRASIYDFQPYVVSGEVEPPANPLVVPQFCFRSNDIDNVGITGRHYTGFIMVGQHAFTAPDAYDQDRYFDDMLAWIVDGMGIPKDEVVLHEDSWGGGGNLGACMEFFVRGLELFNQVYMFYEVDDDAERGYRELDTKVLDMGMGLERIVWMTHGSETSYEANMPGVVEQLYDRTGVEPDPAVWAAFLPWSGHLNLDEVDDIDETWQMIAGEIGEDVDDLQAEILPAAHLYAIADHARTLLVALTDGLLPSNRGERHALRVMARRCFEFIDRYGWDITLQDVVRWQADEFGALYPELQEDVDDVIAIIDHEEAKYEQMKADAERLIADLDDVDIDTLIELYDSKGITPDMLMRHGIDVDVPANFYQMVAERHDEDEEAAAGDTDRIPTGAGQTERLYRVDEYMQDFAAEVVDVAVHDGDAYIVLDRTAFYPTSGGQEHDEGALDGIPVVDVIDQDGTILHRVAPDPGDIDLSPGDTVEGEIDWDRRRTLMRHHTATHIINAAAREVLGGHVWQAGSHKSVEKARLDITHYEPLDRDTLERIAAEANRIVDEDVPVQKRVMDRTAAEREYGFRLYQGGAVPGNEIRVVSIPGEDAEACGGTHVTRTGEVGEIRITGSTKVQDGTIRIEYVAGDVARQHAAERAEIREELGEAIDVDRPLHEIADIFDVEVAQLPRVVDRFIAEWEERAADLDALLDRVDADDLDVAVPGERPRDPQDLFDGWKRLEKDIDTAESALEEQVTADLLESEGAFVEERIDTEDVGMLIRIARHVTREDPGTAVLLVGTNAAVCASGADSDVDAAERVGTVAGTVQGDATFAKGFQLQV